MRKSSLSKDDIKWLKTNIDIEATLQYDHCQVRNGNVVACTDCPIFYQKFDKVDFLKSNGGNIPVNWMFDVSICGKVIVFLGEREMFKDSKTFMERHNEGLKNVS